MTITYLEVVRIMSWSDLNKTGTKFWINVLVFNNWDVASNKW